MNSKRYKKLPEKTKELKAENFENFPISIAMAQAAWITIVMTSAISLYGTSWLNIYSSVRL